ncbi:integrin-linked kinase-associated serine/threonine phosphatase 2C isoform X1 [Lepisosteus oculatus]|uniref:integrin-linked kinase-associated serine/threonine phosphatase 2C isoform X1 n=2 Tax=Lepisosteus oculatus TaxID=7918 RepID=UPI0035F50E13
MDLFGDLPEPTQTTAADTGSSKDSKTEEKPKTEKRKLDTESNGTEQQLEEKKVCKGIPRLKGYVAARKGEREEMQDAHVILPDFSSRVSSLPSQISHLAYFAVFDGHGGSRASRYAAQNLHLNLALKFPKGDAENLDKLVKKCLLDTFKQTDDDFLKHASSQKPAWKDGSTATCMLVMDDVVYVANLGDSRAVLCRGAEESPGKFATLALSKEHNPTCYEERMRIQKAGGMVRDGRILGVLEVSRSLGDGQYKRCGVISTPDVRRCQLTSNDKTKRWKRRKGRRGRKPSLKRRAIGWPAKQCGGAARTTSRSYSWPSSSRSPDPALRCPGVSGIPIITHTRRLRDRSALACFPRPPSYGTPGQLGQQKTFLYGQIWRDGRNKRSIPSVLAGLVRVSPLFTYEAMMRCRRLCLRLHESKV